MHDTDLMTLLRRWWPILLVGALAGGLAGFVAAKSATPRYAASVSLLVGPVNGDYNFLQASGQLSRTYAELAKTRPVLQYAIDKAKADITPRELIDDNDVVATSNDVTRIVSIAVEYPDAETAASLANRIAQRVRALAARRGANAQATLDALLARPEITSLSPAARDNVVTAARQTFASSAAGEAAIIDPAERQTSPVSPNVGLITILAALMGGLLTAGIIVLRESLRRNIVDERSLSALETPAFLGAVSAPLGRGDARDALVVPGGSNVVVEAYLTVATKLGFLDDQPSLRTLLVVDAGDGRQAGIVGANLAAVLADADRSVVLVDADTLSGTATTVLGLGGRPGYSETLTASRDGVSSREPDAIDVFTAAGVHVLPRGVSAGPGTLDEERARRLLQSLRADADVVIVCAAPAHRSPAALVWARVTDGAVLVVGAGETSGDQVDDALSSLQFVRSNVVGTVLGQRSRSRSRGGPRTARDAESAVRGAAQPASSSKT